MGIGERDHLAQGDAGLSRGKSQRAFSSLKGRQGLAFGPFPEEVAEP